MSDLIIDHQQALEPAIDSRQFRNTLGQFATGVIVIATEHQGEIHGMTANAFMSGSMSPPLIIVSVDKRARMHALLQATGRYSVSMLADTQAHLSRHFAGQPQTDKPVNFIDYHGQPVLEGALAWLTTGVHHQYDCGDHTLFVGRVQSLGQRTGCGALGFHRGEYTAL
ncbi:flavin reductase family protein [Shimwellia pseudoproteus]|uniref:flavin reductase family protein n=1 Tax=Shimwellia pseudoproteus TaxID=570012 RepID=UPI0018EB84BF|nr:flavin reductase family protein [Shimwellia pseudoproteus]MBJ3816884.1 flavin reductase family protein [Shimwellia pseudoproteus]